MEERIPVHSSSNIKWTTEKSNFKINDIVLIQTDAVRNSWPMRRIFEINKDETMLFEV